MRSRLAKLNPGPVGSMPLMIGGSGRKVTLRLVAEHADSWNCFGPPDNVRELSLVLDEWCEKVVNKVHADQLTLTGLFEHSGFQSLNNVKGVGWT